MKIIKRNGTEVVFDIEKINKAISKANNAVEEKVRLTPVQISRIAESVTVSCEEMGRTQRHQTPVPGWRWLPAPGWLLGFSFFCLLLQVYESKKS